MPAIQIVTADPYNGQQNVTIDESIVLVFDSELDPFTVEQGVSLYTPSPGLWTGPALSVLDSKYTDVLDITEEYTYFPFNWTLEDNNGITNSKLTLTPVVSLLPDRDYFIAVYPGNDASRYLSKLTTSTPSYVLDPGSTATNAVEINSSYKNDVSGTINIIVTGITETQFTVDRVTEDGETIPEPVDKKVLEFTATDVGNNTTVHTVEFLYGLPSLELDYGPQELRLDYLTLAISDIDADENPVVWSMLDEINIDVFAAEGTDVVLKNKFTTTHLEQGNIPSSTKITSVPRAGDEVGTPALKLVSTIPQNLSIGNIKVNPITLKFNQTITDPQDIQSRITIEKKDMDSGVVRHVNYYYKISGSIVKLYMTSLS